MMITEKRHFHKSLKVQERFCEIRTNQGKKQNLGQLHSDMNFYKRNIMHIFSPKP